MNYYKQGDAAKADKIKAAFEKLGINVLDFGFADKTVVYCSIGGCVQYLPYSINLMNILYSHPDYKELELPVEPKFKFKVGDWIVCWNRTYQIIDNKSTYIVREINSLETRYEHSTVDENGHLWTIADARDGDVITNGKLIVIFNKLEEPAYKQHIIAYVGLDLCGKVQITEDTWQLGIDKAMPATKEQRDLLFQKIKEAGYEWDADKKELKKISPHYDIANFQPFDRVLVRQNNDNVWGISWFSRFEDDEFCTCNNVWFNQCIPFNEDTKHLLGTTDMPSEEFINW